MGSEEPGPGPLMDTEGMKEARHAYIRVMQRINDVFGTVEGGRPPDFKALKRAVGSLVDVLYSHEGALFRLAALRGVGDTLPRHYVNVAVLSLGLGKRFGLSRRQMARLGMAAALHDIGRHWLDEGIFGKEELDEEDIRQVAEHPRLGVQILLKLKGLNEAAVSAMIVAYEHHMNLDGTGYPPPQKDMQMGLFSRIVRVADSFDAATSSGVYGRVALPPDRALELMLGRVGSYYDRTVLTHFYGMVGRYPVGSLVLLSDGSVGVVGAPGGGMEGLERPSVVIVAGPEGASAPGETVELEKPDESRHVVRALDPGRYNVNVYRHLL